VTQCNTQVTDKLALMAITEELSGHSTKVLETRDWVGPERDALGIIWAGDDNKVEIKELVSGTDSFKTLEVGLCLQQIEEVSVQNWPINLVEHLLQEQAPPVHLTFAKFEAQEDHTMYEITEEEEENIFHTHTEETTRETAHLSISKKVEEVIWDNPLADGGPETPDAAGGEDVFADAAPLELPTFSGK